MKKSMVKRIIAWIVLVALLLSGQNIGSIKITNDVYADGIEDAKSNLSMDDMQLFGGSGGSRPSGDNRIISSTFEFASLNVYPYEGRARFYYTDDFFKDSSTIYNNHLSSTSIELAVAGIASYMEEPREKYDNLKDFMSKMGFKNITPNNDYLTPPEDATMGGVCANKPIYIKDAYGNVTKYNLIVTAMRSANYEKEWTSNFKLGESGDHQGFCESRDRVYDHLTTFYNAHKDDFGGSLPIKIWIVGYSRGAAAANMLGAKVTDNATSFNTSKENIYCYTLGTPRGALISEHTATPLDSYTNIHNVITPADPLQLVAPASLGFGRFGIDHEVPVIVSEKVHDETERAARIASNEQYMIKYNQMIEYFRKIDPPAGLNINEFKVWRLILADVFSFKFMEFTDLSLNPFTASSSEAEYYHAVEFLPTFMDKFLGEELMNCTYPGADYGGRTGRARYYHKYQEIITWLVNKALVEDISSMVDKIKQNALDHIMDMLPLLGALPVLIYTGEGVEPSNRRAYPLNPTDPSSATSDIYADMENIYRILLDGAVSTEDFNFLMSKNVDLTDLLLDVLNTDYRSAYLSSQTTLGTIYKNILIWKELHKFDTYIAWLSREDDYYSNPPAETVYIDGNKSVVFTNLAGSVIKIYNEQNNYLGEYTIDASNNVEFTSGLDDEFVNVVKSYNPVGMELRMPSGLKYKAEVIATNSSLGEVVYKEHFTADTSFFRKEKALGPVQLNSGESYIIDFNKSYLQTVFSCIPYDEATVYERVAMKLATISGTTYMTGNTYYSFASEPNIYKAQRNGSFGSFGSVASTSETAVCGDAFTATASSIELATVSTIEIATESEPKSEDDIATKSEPEEETNTDNDADNDTDNDEEESISTQSEIKTNEASDATDTTEETDTSGIATDSDVQVEGFTKTEKVFADTQKYVVKFKTNAAGSIYYYNGSEYVKTKSGASFEPGTKIKITAPIRIGNNTFVGWTLKDNTGRLFHAKNVDTPRIEDLSSGNESAYVITLKNYDINITANYLTSEYTLNLEIDEDNGTLSPEGTALSYNTLEAFNNVKDNVTIVPKGSFTSIYWYDGNTRYNTLADYEWDYSKNVTLRAIFENVRPIPPGGGGGTGGGGGVLPVQPTAPKANTLSVEQAKTTKEMVGFDKTAWRYEPISNTWKLEFSNSSGIRETASSGFYEIVSAKFVGNGASSEIVPVIDTYYFDQLGNMYTGWLQTISDGKWYFFDNMPNADAGKMVIGLREIDGVWYYFDANGVYMYHI